MCQGVFEMKPQASYVHVCTCVSESEPLVLFTWSQRALQGQLGGRPLGPSSPTHSPSPSLQTWRARACVELRPSDWCLMPFGPTPGGTALSWQRAPMTLHCPPVRETRKNYSHLFGCNTYNKVRCSGKQQKLAHSLDIS